MARINAAYDVLRDPVRRARYDSTPHARRDRYADERGDGERSGPPPPPTRPVTGRFDTSALFRERNTTIHREAAAHRATARPRRSSRLRSEQPVPWREWRQSPNLRASLPNGPVYRTVDQDRVLLPTLEESRATVLGFGRFHGSTLGDVAEREPTYIDWIASTITRDRDLVLRARVVVGDLDDRGVERRSRVAEA